MVFSEVFVQEANTSNGYLATIFVGKSKEDCISNDLVIDVMFWTVISSSA